MAIGSNKVGAYAEDTTQNLSVPPPTGGDAIVDGDIVLVIGGMSGSGDDDPNISVSGFTQEAKLGSTAQGDISLGIYWKVANSESGNYTMSIDGGENKWIMAVCIAVAGVDNSDPFDQTTEIFYSANSDSKTPNAIDTQTDGARVFCCVRCVQGTSVSTTQPSGYTFDHERFNLGDHNSVCSKDVPTAGTETPGAWTGFGSGADGIVATFALKPASEGYRHAGVGRGTLRGVGRGVG